MAKIRSLLHGIENLKKYKLAAVSAVNMPMDEYK